MVIFSQIIGLLFGFIIYVIIPVALVKAVLDCKDGDPVFKRVIQLIMVEALFMFFLYLIYKVSINELGKKASNFLFILQTAGVVITLFNIIKAFYKNKLLETKEKRLTIFLFIASFSVLYFALIYFYIMLLDNCSFSSVSNSIIEKLADAFYLSVTNYLNAGTLHINPSSAYSKLIISIQKIFSFSTIILGITFFIKDKEYEDDINKRSKSIRQSYRRMNRENRKNK